MWVHFKFWPFENTKDVNFWSINNFRWANMISKFCNFIVAKNHKNNENSCFLGEIFTFLPNQTSNLNVHCFVWGKFTSAAVLQHSQGTFGTTQELNPYELADPKNSLVPEGFLQPSKTFWICCFVLSKSKHKMRRICLTVKYLTVRVGYVWEIVNRTQIDREICLQKGKYFVQKTDFSLFLATIKLHAKFADHIR